MRESQTRRSSVLLVTLLLGAPALLSADETHPTPLHRAWGTPAPSTLNVGMWTRHVDRPGLDNNALIGGTYRGVFAAHPSSIRVAGRSAREP